MKRKVFDIFVWIMTFVFVGLIFAMPQRIPLHWNYEWQIDGYGSRYFMCILAFVPLAVYYGMLLTKRIDPHKRKIEQRGKTYDIFRDGLTAFFVLLVAVFYYLVFYPQTNPKSLLFILLAAMFIGMGNYMPRVPQNYFLGIKTPWTLSSDYVWKKTHRLGGYAWIVIGVVIAIIGLFDLPYDYIVMIVLVVGSVILTTVYSYVIYKRMNTKNIDEI